MYSWLSVYCFISMTSTRNDSDIIGLTLNTNHSFDIIGLLQGYLLILSNREYNGQFRQTLQTFWNCFEKALYIHKSSDFWCVLKLFQLKHFIKSATPLCFQNDSTSKMYSKCIILCEWKSSTNCNKSAFCFVFNYFACGCNTFFQDVSQNVLALTSEQRLVSEVFQPKTLQFKMFYV